MAHGAGWGQHYGLCEGSCGGLVSCLAALWAVIYPHSQAHVTSSMWDRQSSALVTSLLRKHPSALSHAAPASLPVLFGKQQRHHPKAQCKPWKG